MLTPERLAEVGRLAGRHTGFGSSPPSDPRERELWGLVEILDFKCFKYGDAPTDVTEAEAKEYLLAHKDEVLALKCPPPSYMGLFAGVLDFLRSESVEEAK